MSPLTLVRAGTDAIPTIMRFERQPGYEVLVGRWSEAEHARAMADPGTVYLLGCEDGTPRGSAMLLGLDNPHGNILLRRIVVEQAGQGFGRRFFLAVVDWVFTTTLAHRLWLTVLETNARAHHVYRTSGFRDDGMQRESFVRPDGQRVSQYLMSMLRPEWEARQGRPAAESK